MTDLRLSGMSCASCAAHIERGLNELFPGRHDDAGIIVQGGLYNAKSVVSRPAVDQAISGEWSASESAMSPPASTTT